MLYENKIALHQNLEAMLVKNKCLVFYLIIFPNISIETLKIGNILTQILKWLQTDADQPIYVIIRYKRFGCTLN